MNTKYLTNAVYWLKRVIVNQNDVDLLIETIEALEKEIKRRDAKRNTPN
jgi:hypothetical protein